MAEAEPSLLAQIIAGVIPSDKVAEGAGWFAFLHPNPRRHGHCVIASKEQAVLLADLTEGSRSALLSGAVEVQRRLAAVIQTREFSVVLPDGPLSGQEIPHVHLHVHLRRLRAYLSSDNDYCTTHADQRSYVTLRRVSE